MDDVIAELLEPLTDSRRAHSIGVGQRMESVVDVLPSALRSAAVAAAYLHDVGYGHPDVGFHPIDGARLLRSRGYSEIVCHVVAFHTAAEVEARVRGLDPAVFEEFRLSNVVGLDIVDDFMCWADLCTGPNGEDFTVDERLNEIMRRYEPGSIVYTSITQAEPRLRRAVQRVSGSM
ncbi:HD domain-containing protein [Nocardia nova]|uniref:HD domain-containing protein n=1 Tax=Nocardia nova TaxID=37330 RepID=UPI003411DC74